MHEKVNQKTDRAKCYPVLGILLGRRQRAIYRLILRQNSLHQKMMFKIFDSSATLIGQLAIGTLFGAILGGIPLSGPYPILFLGPAQLRCHSPPYYVLVIQIEQV